MTLNANSCKGCVNKGTIHATTQYRAPAHLIAIHVHVPQIFCLFKDPLPLVPFRLARRIQDILFEGSGMEDGKWVHGICRSEDAVRDACFDCDIFFALFRWANERTKTQKIQGYRLKSEACQRRYSGGKGREAYVGGYKIIYRLYFPHRVRICLLFCEDN